MKHRLFSAGTGTVVVLFSLVLILTGQAQQTSSDECCLCNDCDMTMTNLDATVYDIDEDKLVDCSDFAELIFTHVKSTSDSCHAIQAIYQLSCCLEMKMDTTVLKTNHQEEAVAMVDHRVLMKQLSIPFSKRELQWTAYSAANPGATSSYNSGPYQGFGMTQQVNNNNNSNGWGLNNGSNSQPIAATTTTSNNGNALGCVVPDSHSSKVVQVFPVTATGFAQPVNVNCASASYSGLPMSTGDPMYNVGLKCVRCSCCSAACTGTDANVCVGNNQPRSGTAVGWTVNSASAGNGWRHRLLEYLAL